MSSNICKFVLYTDDTNIFVVGTSETKAYKKAQLVVDAIYNYMYENQLHINVVICSMHFRCEYSNKKNTGLC